VKDGISPPAVAPSSLSAVGQGSLGDEEPALQRTACPVNVLIPIEEVVPSVQNPLTSSEAFFMVDSSGRQRMSNCWVYRPPQVFC
jgi:hypothetical protein